jgi:hypothetical protein
MMTSAIPFTLPLARLSAAFPLKYPGDQFWEEDIFGHADEAHLKSGRIFRRLGLWRLFTPYQSL